MKLFFIALASLACAAQSSAQKNAPVIDPAAAERIEKVLSADNMRGRATFSHEIDKAAEFIESQFKAAGLQTWNGSGSYRQPFSQVSSKTLSVTATLDGTEIPAASVAIASSSAQVSMDEQSGYEKAYIKAGDNLGALATRYLGQYKTSYIVFVDTSFTGKFSRLASFASQGFSSQRNIIFILAATTPSRYSVKAQQQIEEKKLANVVGILPGRSRKDEYVIFSGHYDHIGVGQPNEKGDSIFNGANDDASGTAAVILLADYFGKLHNNERTLIFATFTAEEIGGYGSQYFSRQFDPSKVMAMFNIEMIGTESKWGVNSAYITGYEKTDMGKILEKNLAGTQFKFYPDPYPDQQLFYRSDNATLARQGVPAHTISTSKMDSEKFYHTQGDEIGTLDMKNMAQIVRSIALSSQTIIAGKDTPSRVDAAQLR